MQAWFATAALIDNDEHRSETDDSSMWGTTNRECEEFGAVIHHFVCNYKKSYNQR